MGRWSASQIEITKPRQAQVQGAALLRKQELRPEDIQDQGTDTEQGEDTLLSSSDQSQFFLKQKL